MVVTWSRARYRIDQFIQTLVAPLLPVDKRYVQRVLKGLALQEAQPQLEAALWNLFDNLPRAEQRHAISVCKALETRGFDRLELLVAALFHDVGKSISPPGLIERVWVVLVEHFAPYLANRWSQGEPHGVRRGFVMRRAHPVWGAQLLEQAGVPPSVTVWVAQHHSPPGNDRQLAALQASDEA